MFLHYFFNDKFADNYLTINYLYYSLFSKILIIKHLNRMLFIVKINNSFLKHYVTNIYRGS